MTKKNERAMSTGSMNIDPNKLIDQIAGLIDSKIAAALEANASGKGAPVKTEPNRAGKALKESYTIGGVDLSLDSISKRGTAYSRNNKMLIIDEETGKRFYVWGALIAPCTSDEVPDGVQFIASVKA